MTDLPKSDNLAEIQRSNKNWGRLTTFIDQIQAGWLSILTLVLLVGYGVRSENKFGKLEQKITVVNQNYVGLPEPSSTKKPYRRKNDKE